MSNPFVNPDIVQAVQNELSSLELIKEELIAGAQRCNKDVRYIKGYTELNDQIARLRKALKPLINQYH
ncbi:hypothetical protein VPHD63_0054 [Vibrio phage D63]